jgi:hypothetical protein
LPILWPREYRYLAEARDPACVHEPLATLGESLALGRVSVSAGGAAGGTFDVGPYEKQEVHLLEVDAESRCLGGEVFPVGRLADAIARLYERAAEILPDGPARTRAAVRAGVGLSAAADLFTGIRLSVRLPRGVARPTSASRGVPRARGLA